MQSNLLLKKEIQLLRETSIKSDELQADILCKEQEVQRLKSQLQ